MDYQWLDKHKHVIVATTLAAILLILMVVYLLILPFHPNDDTRVVIEIHQGQGLKMIAQTLKDQGVIRSRWVFIVYAALTGRQSRLQAGDYMLGPALSVPEIVQMLANGLAIPKDISVVIPEGFNIWDIDQQLLSAELIKSKGIFARHFYTREGRLFPDTYRFDKDATIFNIANKLLANFSAKTPSITNQELIVASILEKEAKEKEDMELVAGIIYKRLKLKMPLQIDATVSYGWCLRRSLENNFSRDCDVSQAPVGDEIKIDGSYNTYTHSGLPAGPISNPGLVAIQAAQHPKASDYLYYLSTRDGSQLIYAKTPAEHQANRRKYLGL